MLVEFSVENFLSFKERITFSMLASKDTEHEDTNVITLENGKRYLKTAVIYGANASGKSNLLKAMDFMADFVRKSHQMQIGTPIGVVPYKLEKDCLDKPSKFDIIFYSEGIRYAYGFSATNKVVVEESLYYYPNGRQSIIFERTNVNEYKFTDNKDIQNSIKDRNTDNKLYLSTSSNWNFETVVPAFRWFQNTMIFYSNKKIIDYAYSALLFDENLFDFVLDWIKSIDVGIDDVRIKNIPTSLDMATEKLENIMLDYVDTIHTQKTGITNNKISFKFDEESEGTRRFFLLALTLAGDLFSKNRVITIDELDIKLHSLLTRAIVEKFNSKENYNNIQFVFSTHDTNLLDLNLFRRDQIWFTEKNPDTGATDLYSLYDFGVRKDVNIEKGYLLGRYGAIPFIGGNING